MDIRLRSYLGDGAVYWSLTFISYGFVFTDADLEAVRLEVEAGGLRFRRRGGSALPSLDDYDRPGGGPRGTWRGGWNRIDGGRHIYVSSTRGERPRPGLKALHILAGRYPQARFSTSDGQLAIMMGDPVVRLYDPERFPY